MLIAFFVVLYFVGLFVVTMAAKIQKHQDGDACWEEGIEWCMGIFWPFFLPGYCAWIVGNKLNTWMDKFSKNVKISVKTKE
jgi:hypothetical protein